MKYPYSRYGYTRGGGKIWHGGIDVCGLDDDKIRMPGYNGKSIAGTVVTARIVTNKRNKTWEWGYYVCVKLDANQTPDAVNYLYFAHCSQLLVDKGTKVKTGDVLAVVGQTGNAAGTWTHCHFEVRATATSKGLDPTAYAGILNKAGTYGDQPAQTSGKEVLIDVSHHQGIIDWAKVPYRALVRIGYRGYGSGALMKDEQFNANLAGAKANNKLLGFYFFSQAITEDEARAEADFCASLAPNRLSLVLRQRMGTHNQDRRPRWPCGQPDQGAAHGLRPSVLCTCGGAGLPAGRLHVYVVCHGKHRLRGPVQGLHWLAGRHAHKLRQNAAAPHPPIQPDRKGRRGRYHWRG